MSIQHFSTTNGGAAIWLMASVAAVILWFTVALESELPYASKNDQSLVTQCLNATDVIDALDRSRNGISLSCNNDKLPGSTTR